MSKLPDAPELEYREWLQQALALLDGQNMMQSGEWVRLYVKGRPPEEAAAIAKTYSNQKTPAGPGEDD
jgi:hypothetical protein